MNRIFVTADLHIGHDNLSLLEERGFTSTEFHDLILRDNWNSLVNPNDTVWVLGDVTLKRENLPFLATLNGYKHLILGNHDIFGKLYFDYFSKVLSSTVIKRCLLTHIPVKRGHFRSANLNIHGHLHSKRIADRRNYYCVSLEQTEMKPVLLDEIVEKCNAN